MNNLDEKYEFLSPETSSILPFFYNTTGLGFLVKKELKAQKSFIEYKDSKNWVCLWGALCKRGLFNIETTNINGKQIVFSTTHLTPLVNMKKYRDSEIDEISHFINSISFNKDWIFLGDFNLSEFFGPLADGDDGNIETWTANSTLYNKLISLRNSLCKDTYSGFTKNYRFTQNRELNLTAQLSPSAGKAPSQRNDIILQSHQQIGK